MNLWSTIQAGIGNRRCVTGSFGFLDLHLHAQHSSRPRSDIGNPVVQDIHSGKSGTPPRYQENNPHGNQCLHVVPELRWLLP